MGSDVAARVFKVSDLAHAEHAFSEAVRRGQARLQAADGTNLAVLPEHALLTLTEIVRWSTQHLVAEVALRKPASERSAADFGECEWLEALDDEDLSTFLDELGTALLVAARQHTVEELHQLLSDWRVTAEVLRYPEDRDILLGGYEDSDFVEANRPE